MQNSDFQYNVLMIRKHLAVNKMIFCCVFNLLLLHEATLTTKQSHVCETIILYK